MYINWKGPLITINPKTGFAIDAKHPNGIPVPNYGHFGGPLIQGGKNDPGVDSLDALFKKHDESIPTPNDPKALNKLLEAHATLIGGIIALEDDGLLEVRSPLNDPKAEYHPDAEATLYGGVTLFALTAQVMQLDDPEHHVLHLFEADLAGGKPALNVSTVLTNAAEYMENGLEAVPSNESKGLNGLFHIWEKQFDAFIA